MLRCLTRHARRFTTVNHGRRRISVQSGDELYLPGTTLDLQFQAEGCNTFEPQLAVTVVKRFEPFTSAALLLVRQHSDNEKTILTLADRRLGYCGGRPPSKDICNTPYVAGSSLYAMTRRPDIELWEDWMWEVSTWRYKLSNHSTGLAAYRLLHLLQGWHISYLFGLVHLRITPNSTLHPVTDIVQGLVLDCIPGVSMAKLKPSVDVSEQEAEMISSQVMDALHAIEAAKCVLRDDIHIGNIVLRDGSILQSSESLNSAMKSGRMSSGGLQKTHVA